jgi:hypothetical protein
MMDRHEQLQCWLNDLRREQEEVMAALDPLLRRREELRQKTELVQRLLSLESDSQPELRISHPDNGGVQDSTPLERAGHRTGTELQEAVKEILREYGKPMHISDIRSALVDKGIPIPGRGTDANIIVHLRRAPDVFERKNRGTYGLLGPEKKLTKGSPQ